MSFISYTSILLKNLLISILIYFINQKPIQMKKFKFLVGISILSVAAIFSSCEKENAQMDAPDQTISSEVIAKIHHLGFSTDGVIKANEGYIVEGDIMLTEEALNTEPNRLLLKVGDAEQYHTTNLVTGLPRVITVSVSSSLPSNFGPALQEAVNRYNAEDLQITFQIVSSGADISITEGPWWWSFFGILGMGGFPADGDPYNSVQLSSSAFNGASTGYLATVIAHEIGHNIGFRHTDYMDRSYSCGGSADNEGETEYGAIHVPGTPVNPDALSWMLSCSDGSDVPFNANDKIALDYLY